MELTQKQIDVLSQNLRMKRIKIELLDFDLRIIDRIEGHIINGSITANANNDIRRSGNIEMAIPIIYNAEKLIDKLDGFTIEYGGKIWLDKYVKIYIGIDNLKSIEKETIWYKMGVFLINKPTRNFSSQSFTISFECIDLMAKLTGLRQGQLTGQTTIIEQGHYDEKNVYIKTKLADVFAETITNLAGITKYTIYPIPDKYKYLPYEIKLGVGSTVYDILKELMNILSTWEIYFDLDGILRIEPIPSGKNAIVYNIDSTQYISSNLSYNFENVKNQIVVYGKINTLTYYTENTEEETDNVSYIGDTLSLKYSSINTETLYIGATTFGFFSTDKINTSKINKVKIYNDGSLLFESNLVKFENSKNSFGVNYETNQIEIGQILPNEVYFIRIYSATQNLQEDGTEILDTTQPIVFEFMGKQSVSYCLVNDNKESPFYINRNIKETNYYAGTATNLIDVKVGQEYTLKLNNDSNFNGLKNGDIITFMANGTNLANPKININDSLGNKILEDIPLVKNKFNKNGSRDYVDANILSNDYTIWKIKYEYYNSVQRFVLLGRNNDTITKICAGGEYDNINADQLAYERCIYELFTTSNLNDTIEFCIIPNYLLDVNKKIPYNENFALPKNIDANIQEALQYYIIKNITFPLGLDNKPQNISASRIYESGNLLGEDY